MYGTRTGNLRALLRGAGLGRRADAEVLGGLHQAISVEPDKWVKLKGASMRRASTSRRAAPRSSCSDPDGARLGLISDPLGDRYGLTVL